MTERWAMITGASRGIGLATAQQLAQAGYHCVICGRDEDKLAQCAAHIRAASDRQVLIQAFDISHRCAVDTAWQQIAARIPHLDVLVNNAGMALGIDRLAEANPDDWDQMIDINVKGALYLLRHVAKVMQAQGKGHIINVGSISGHSVYAGGVVYCASKYALRAISEGLKIELHGTGVRVTHISPGFVRTEFSLNRFSGNQQQAEAVYTGMTPLSADDVAAAIVYAAQCPAHVNIKELTIMPTDQTAHHLVHRHSSQQGSSYGSLVDQPRD